MFAGIALLFYDLFYLKGKEIKQAKINQDNRLPPATASSAALSEIPIQDNLAAINARIKKFEQELKDKKISICVESEAHSPYIKQKQIDPPHIRAMNRHIDKFDNSRRIFKSQAARRMDSSTRSVREHYEAFNGIHMRKTQTAATYNPPKIRVGSKPDFAEYDLNKAELGCI